MRAAEGAFAHLVGPSRENSITFYRIEHDIDANALLCCRLPFDGLGLRAE